MKPAEGFLGAIGAIESDSGNHDFRSGGFHDRTFLELLDDIGTSVTEFEAPESSSFGGRRVVFAVVFFKGMIFSEPRLVFDVKFCDVEGDNATALFEGDLLLVRGNEVCFEGLLTIGTSPETAFKES